MQQSDDEEPEEVAADPAVDATRRARLGSADVACAIFPANNPPSRRRPPPAISGSTKKRKTSTAAVPNLSTAAAPAAAASIPTRDTSQPTELLDDRDLADPDEQYNDNERALTHFLRLHPMLSLDATSERMLTTVAKMVDDYAIETKELEVVSRTHDEMFLAPATKSIGERDCVNAHKCIARWLAVFRFGEDTKNAFVCKEFLLPSQRAEWMKTGELPKTPAKCLLCSRYFTVRP